MPELDFYHLSDRPLGPRPILTPRRPRDPMAGEHSRVRRLCVAPSVAGALAALARADYNRGRWWIYCVDDPEAEPVPPLAVPDAHRTGERWLLGPTRFRYAGTLSAPL